MSIFIIAEAGVNHNGSLEIARQLVAAAAAAGADAVKFQTFKADNLVSRSTPKAEYQTRTTAGDESHYEMIRRLELDEAAHAELIRYCSECSIRFLSTPFDAESLALLAGRFGLSLLKLPSGEITNAPLLLQAGRTGRQIVLSTGMSSLGEIEAALGVLAFGLLGLDEPSEAAFRNAFDSDAGQRILKEKVTLLHCTSEYPAPCSEVNLLAMDTLRGAFGLPVGYSDHTEGIAVPIAAAALGAVVIEKHFTLDRNLPGPDHRASLEPDELRQMVAAIRLVEQAKGTGGKHVAPSERKNMPVARKSLVAAVPIAPGELFTEANLTVKRPGTGIPPTRYWQLLGTAARRRYAADEVISE